MIKNINEINDKQLEKVNGGLAFDYNQCPCGNFSPFDGDWDNKSTYNCKYYVMAQQSYSDVCYDNGVCRNYK